MAADVEQMLVAWLDEQFPDARLCTETPSNLADVLPAVRVVRVGGGRQYSLHHPNVVVDAFGASRSAAKALALDVANALYRRLPGVTVAGGVVGGVEEISGPSWAPWDNTTLRRVTAVYRLHIRDAH